MLVQGTKTIPLTVTSNVTTDPQTGLQSVSFLVGEGIGSGWSLLLSVAGQAANVTTQAQRDATKFSFEAPILSSLTNTSGPTSGGYNVTVFGMNFGSADDFAALGKYVFVCLLC